MKGKRLVFRIFPMTIRIVGVSLESPFSRSRYAVSVIFLYDTVAMQFMRVDSKDAGGELCT